MFKQIIPAPENLVMAHREHEEDGVKFSPVVAYGLGRDGHDVYPLILGRKGKLVTVEPKLIVDVCFDKEEGTNQ